MAEPVRVPLTKGAFALVDAADAARVLAFSWRLYVKKSQPGRFYAVRTVREPATREGKQSVMWLHRFIVNAAADEFVDHRSGDGLDNQRGNLRRCTRRENATNVTSSKRQKLGGYKGVTWNKTSGKWQASICAGEVKPNGKRRQLYLGVFVDPVEAARAYDREALAKFGEFACLNFPAEQQARAS
jgi:hypothetical protein